MGGPDGVGLRPEFGIPVSRYDYRGKLLRGTEILALCGMLLTSLTLDHSIADWNTKRVLHWIGAILYAAGLVASLLLILNYTPLVKPRAEDA